MTKRQCLTCGFFQPSGSDSMGWCNNPRRKIASDIRLYVRAHELPCRDSWDHDLWEDKTAFSAPDDVVLSNNVAPVAPASIDDLVFLASAQRAAEAEESNSQATVNASPVSSVDRVIREESASATIENARVNSARGSVRRAHQQMLADKRTERFADGATSTMDGGFSLPAAPVASARDAKSGDRLYEAEKPAMSYSATRPVFNAVPPVQPSEMDRSIPKIAIYPGEEDRFSSVPRPVDGVQLPKRAPREQATVIRAAYLDDEHETDGKMLASAEPDHINSQARAAMLAQADPEIVTNRTAPPMEAPRAELATEAIEAEVELLDEGRLMEHDFSPITRPRLRAGGLFRNRRRQRVEPMDETAAPADNFEELDEPFFDERPMAPVFELQAPVRPESRLSLQALAEDDVDDVDSDAEDFGPSMARSTELWADVPRMCRTCRDFRPAESGDRGWCNNKWAFNHRRMVDADECPCDSSVGCWWLPHDDVWLSVSDISAHGQPTPLLDLWLGQRRGRDSDAESASIGRRRRG